VEFLLRFYLWDQGDRIPIVVDSIATKKSHLLWPWPSHRPPRRFPRHPVFCILGNGIRSALLSKEPRQVNFSNTFSPDRLFSFFFENHFGERVMFFESSDFNAIPDPRFQPIIFIVYKLDSIFPIPFSWIFPHLIMCPYFAISPSPPWELQTPAPRPSPPPPPRPNGRLPRRSRGSPPHLTRPRNRWGCNVSPTHRIFFPRVLLPKSRFFLSVLKRGTGAFFFRPGSSGFRVTGGWVDLTEQVCKCRSQDFS